MALTLSIIKLIEESSYTIRKLAEYHDGGLWRRSGNEPDLCGYCGLASRFLVNLFKRNDIRNMKLICGKFDSATHCWVEMDGFCIDLTISQFSGFENKKYKICRIDDSFYNKYYKANLMGNRAIKHQNKWEDGQNYGAHAIKLWQLYRQLYCQGL